MVTRVMTTVEIDTEETVMDKERKVTDKEWKVMDKERKVTEEGIVMNLMATDVTVIMTTAVITSLMANMNVVSPMADQMSTKQ